MLSYFSISPYIQGSFNEKGEILPKLFAGEKLFTVAPFSKKSIVMDLFMSQKTVNITFFTDHCA